MRIIIDRDLKLRPYNIKDKTSLYKNSTDPLFLKYMEYNKFSYAQFNSWLKIKIKSKDTIFFVIEYKKKAIGTYILTISGVKKQVCDLSYGIASEYFGKKIFTKITKKILEKFKRFKRFSAITRKDNLASVKGLKKLKFKEEGILKAYYFDLKSKKYYDAMILSYIIS
jgi:RimJ/RimL family protein N-acetyltransferase|tara:strand:+ start:1288 stop:1791 length:504 start_codon:yes stop_codon:yes gene_type:complete